MKGPLPVRYEEIVTSGQKIAVSLLTTVVIFACFTVAAFAGLFSQIEARFYEPSKVAVIRKQLDAVSESNETYIKTLLDRFGTGAASYVRTEVVSSYLAQTPADADVQQRTKVTGTLFSETPGLDGIRLVDANGRNVHFSTYPADIVKQTDTLRMYKNYDELKSSSGENEFSYESVAASDSLTGGAEKYRIRYDGKNARLIFSFPFYDSYSAYRGTMLFYVNAEDFDRTLVMQNIVTMNDSCMLVSSSDGTSGGFVFGMPNVGHDIIEPRILLKWQGSSHGPDKLVSVSETGADADDSGWILISGRENSFMRISGVYRASAFVMPRIVQVLLLVCVFVTLFLVIFLAFSLRRDDIVVIRDRIRRLQFALINEYLENRESIDWNDVLRKISGRRQDVSDEIKKSLGYRAKRHAEETDALIGRSWDEIIDALGTRSKNVLASPDRETPQNSMQDRQEIRRMLEEILQNGSIKVHAVEAPSAERTPVSAVKPAAKDMKEAEPVEEIEPLEEIPEAESVGDVESVEKNEPLEEIPEAEPVEDMEAVDEAGPLKEIPEAEPVDGAEPAEQVEPPEEVLEAEPDESAEPVGEIEPLEEIPEAESVEDAEIEDGAESVEKNEPLKGTPETESADEAEPVEEIEPIEEIPEAEPVEDAEPAKEAESSAKEIEPPEEMPETESADGAETAEDTAPAERPPEKGQRTDSVAIDEFIDSENRKNAFPPAGNFTPEPLQFGEPVRRSYHPKEAAKTVEDFNVAPSPDFTFLDENAGAEDAAGVKGDEMPVADEDVTLESFGVENEIPVPRDLRETPEFGSISPKETAAEEDKAYDAPVFDLEPVMPDFDELDESDDVDLRGPEEETNADAVPEDVRPLADEKEAAPFVFARFGANNNNVYELVPAAGDAIVEDRNGLFSISPDLVYTDIVQNPAFKKLVDSVLR